eukprot:TRINITY_DN4151_c0_g1_i2.p1 TRINITY_DN4151_c0_g1~~TRINITY_DN4151_c0_g1_i2.p1  ORF type:complete len:760 (-),score=115.64 TRINITY_DN4151_c0_g1_i2:204-2378(-)
MPLAAGPPLSSRGRAVSPTLPFAAGGGSPGPHMRATAVTSPLVLSQSRSAGALPITSPITTRRPLSPPFAHGGSSTSAAVSSSSYVAMPLQASSPSRVAYRATSPPVSGGAMASSSSSTAPLANPAVSYRQASPVLSAVPSSPTAASPFLAASPTAASPFLAASPTAGSSVRSSPTMSRNPSGPLFHRSTQASRSRVPAQSSTAAAVPSSSSFEVQIGEYRLRCIDVLGRGSYSIVYRAERLNRHGVPDGSEVLAMKEVRCSTEAALTQAVFEVKVLLAVEQAGSQPGARKVPQPLRVPRCLAYCVDQCDDGTEGWTVRTAMTVVPGESLDLFFRHPLPAVCNTVGAAFRRACALAEKCLRDVGPVLKLLEPVAWHRDVNSHNILVDVSEDQQNLTSDVSKATFWLIDFGLAVESRSWVSPPGKWQTEHIGGDSRYWPTSSWIMHLLGPGGFAEVPQLCEQYQRRLDIHGLGITALELLCAVAMAIHGNQQDGLALLADDGSLLAGINELLVGWQTYWKTVWRWWSMVYAVFSRGGDIAPVQLQLMQEGLIERLRDLLEALRQALLKIAQRLPPSEARSGRVLRVLADMIDENCAFDLDSIPERLLPAAEEAPRQDRHGRADQPQVAVPQEADSSLLVSVAMELRHQHACRSQCMCVVQISLKQKLGAMQRPANGKGASVESMVKRLEERLSSIERRRAHIAKAEMASIGARYMPQWVPAVACN